MCLVFVTLKVQKVISDILKTKSEACIVGKPAGFQFQMLARETITYFMSFTFEHPVFLNISELLKIPFLFTSKP
jgi:hypothetical protein